MRKFLAVMTAGLALGAMGSAQAQSLRFDGVNPGPMAVDVPINATTPCGTIGFDFCDVNGDGLLYDLGGGITVLAQGLANDLAAEIIQDIRGPNQGLGVQSEGVFSLDQVNVAAGESILFSFSEEVTLRNIEFNDGLGQDCPGGGLEGVCGLFDLIIDEGLASEVTLTGLAALAVVSGGWVGQTFEFIHTSPIDGGFSIAALSIPLPAALPIFLTGLGLVAGASRRRKKTA